MDSKHASSSIDDAPSVALGPAEWLLLLPAPPQPPATMSGAAPPPDPAAGLRVASPLTLSAFVSALAEKSPALARSVLVQTALEPSATRPLLRYLILWVSFVPLLVPAWMFNDGRFGSRQLAVGTATLTVGFFGATLFIGLFAAYRASLAALGAVGGKAGHQGAKDREYSSHGAAGLARWIQYCSGALGPRTGRLLEHDAKDSLCPCPNPSCAGNLARRAGTLRILEAAFKLSTVAFAAFCFYWTPLASAGIAQRTWTEPWSTPFAALAVLGLVVLSVPIGLVRFSTNLALLDLSRRVGLRAVRISLGEMLARYRSLGDPVPLETDDPAAPDFAAPAPASPNIRPGSVYLDMHILFTSAWRRRILFFGASLPHILAATFQVAMATINAAACSCIPAVYLIYLCYTLSVNLVDLVNVAAANSQIEAVRGLYLDALLELRSLLRRAALSPSLEDAALLRAASADADVLASLVEVDRYRARFLGFAVTFGMVRTLGITMVTLGVAMWSVLRGLGVWVTMENVCTVGP